MSIKGIRYPIEPGPQGFLTNTTDLNQIKSSMLMIILSLNGERVMEPEFGTPLHAVNMLQPIEMIEQQVRMMVASSIKRFEKRVQVEDVVVTATQTQIQQYDIKIEVMFLQPANLQVVEKLSVETTIGAYVYCR